MKSPTSDSFFPFFKYACNLVVINYTRRIESGFDLFWSSYMSLLMAHRCGEELGFGDNSSQSIVASLEKGFDIIELDVRKSKDWSLYCFHWTAREVMFYKFVFKSKTIASLKKERNVMTVREAFELIWDKAAIFLDIKEYDISAQEIAQALTWFKLGKVYIWWLFSLNKLLSYQNLKDRFSNIILVYVNMNPFGINFNKIFQYGIDIIQVFHWHIDHQIQDIISKVSITPMFVSRETYADKAKEYKLHYVHTDKI